MKIIKNPSEILWQGLAQRPELDLNDLELMVRSVFERVKSIGDHAIKEYTEQFDKVKLSEFEVSQKELKESGERLTDELKNSIIQAAENIRKFHEAQLRSPLTVETMPGITCQRISRPIERIGLYVPGGSAPLFSTVLMLAIPAMVAGCKSITLCTPPMADGSVHPAILFAAQTTGVNKIIKVGGAQAIAAMTFGTATIPKADKIFGPGNQYVTMAKRIAAESGVAIDLPAGPSEVLVIADENANPVFVAADLLSQAEHGPDSQVVLTTTNEQMANEVVKEIAIQSERLSRKKEIVNSLKNSLAVIFPDIATCVAFSNLYAPEHLIINTTNPEHVLNLVENAGSVFLGSYTPEAAGDYASGTNHTLPTNGFAKMYSGVSTDSFIKNITIQKITKEGIKILGPIVEQMAEAEGLDGHKNAVSVRLNTIK